MTEFNWENEIKLWVESKRKIKPYLEDLIKFFQIAFHNTSSPEKSWFGTCNSSISLLTGEIYFAAYKGGTIWLLLDKPFNDMPNSNSSIVKSTKSFNEPLFWFETKDLKNLKILLQRNDIWESFKAATIKIYDSKKVTAYRERLAKNKVLLSDFLIDESEVSIYNENQIQTDLQEEIKKAKKLTQSQRLKLIEQSNPVPKKYLESRAAFRRNGYVITEVLYRANGICERCKKPAPFNRDNDETPYLEVHHKITLAEGGLDTVQNAIALCPNCHRQAHYGKGTY